MSMLVEKLKSLSPDELRVLADLLRDSGRLDSAATVYRFLVAKARAEGDAGWEGWGWLGQASVSILARDPALSLSHVAKAKILFGEASNLEGMATCLLYEGECAVLQGYPGKARAAYKACVDLYKKLGQDEKISLVTDNIGRVLHQEGKFAAARRYYLAALNRAEQKRDLNAERIWLQNLALLEEDAGHPRKAYRFLERCLACVGRLAQAFEPGEQRRESLLNMLGPEREIVRLCMDLGWNRKALEWLEASRERGYGDSITRKIRKLPHFQHRECLFITFFVYHGPVVALGFDPGDPACRVILRSIGVTGIELVEQVLTDESFKAFTRLAVGRGSSAQVFKEALSTADVFQTKLHRLLFAPLEDIIVARDPHYLVLAPSDILGHLPLHIAVRPAGTPTMTTVTVPSLHRFHAASRPRQLARPGVLGIAGHNGELPCARVELVSAITQVGDGKILCSSEITLNHVVSPDNRYRVIHFACEAFFGGSDLSATCLVLSGEKVTLSSIFQLEGQLEDVELVILSACNSGRMRMNLTEDSLSLAGAFLRAGVRGVVSSLYRVPDPVCALWLHVFYKHLCTGNQPPAAVREAQAWAARAGYSDVLKVCDEICGLCDVHEHRDTTVIAGFREQVMRFLRTCKGKRPMANPILWGAFSYAGAI